MRSGRHIGKSRLAGGQGTQRNLGEVFCVEPSPTIRRVVQEAKQQVEDEANQQHFDVVFALEQQLAPRDMAKHNLLAKVWLRQFNWPCFLQS